MRLPRLRLLIWLTVLAVLYAAALFVFGVYIDPCSSWRHTSFVVVSAFAVSLMSLVLVLAVVLGRWPAKFFTFGFVLGAVLENRAMGYYATHDLLQLTPGTWVPKCWYPLTVPVERAFIERG